MKTKKVLLLALVSCSAMAEDYSLVGVDANGTPLSSCPTLDIVSPISYTDSDCKITMNLSAGGQPLTVNLGTCPTNHKIKLILDDHMYKYNANIDGYNNLLEELDVIALNDVLENCQGNGTVLSNLELFSQSDIVDLDEDFGVRWGVDSNDKPVIHIKSLSGNVVCDDAIPVVVTSNDFIFANGFDF